MSEFQVGIAQVDITPKLGVPLSGNFRVDYAARGVHDPLHAKAIVIKNSKEHKIALLSVDVCDLGRENVAMIRNQICNACDIRYDNILISATHTHSGPTVTRLGSLPIADTDTISEFLEKAASSVVLANQELYGSKLFFGSTNETRLSFNRRILCRDGKTHMNWENLDPEFVLKPLGPIDPQVIALTFEHQNRPNASLVNFGLHPAILAGDNWLYSADYPNYLSEAMSQLIEQNLMTLFFNGCCGDVNHIDYKDKTQGRGYQMTQRVGYILAVKAFEAMKAQVPVRGNTLSASTQKVELKRLKITKEQKEWSKNILKKSKITQAKGQEDGLPDEFYAKIWQEMSEQKYSMDHAEVMVMRVGDVGIVGLSGEIFCELGLEIKKKSPTEHTIVIEQTNDSIGYIPTVEAFEGGGYEVTPGITFYEKGSGEKLVLSALSQLKRLFEN